MNRKDCDILVAKITKVRCPYCELCGTTSSIEAHHTYFRSKADWGSRFDPLFSISLCHECHQNKPYAPHINNNLFFGELAGRFKTANPIRYTAIISYPPRTPDSKPDYNVIGKILKNQLAEIERDAWIDQDIIPEHGRNVI